MPKAFTFKLQILADIKVANLKIVISLVVVLANEDNDHFLLHCPQYYTLRLDLFDQLSDIMLTSQESISLASMRDPSVVFFYMEAPVVA